MIIQFLGCPSSGKTTTASRLFSNLKESSFKCEFIPEQARFFIAERRVSLGLQPNEKLTLSDEDQYEILSKQIYMEDLMLNSCGQDTIVVSDSSPLNALLYMTESFRDTYKVKIAIDFIKSQNRLYFYATPVSWHGGSDPNRIHTYQESLDIDKKINTLLLPLVNQSVLLTGTPEIRARLATSEVMSKLMFNAT